ncbi:peptidoglycan/LPS O-acetylase OafA/YrhL [Sphingomonas kyeonggiensis]|uniref:Peptidoglycan/LPS O-acetylase OafA/YrhL n=1 Tax=Sphingomonas kyeonggiensis TaxID=1268553 RepID=A0A7W7K461_9SPHN|nr:acyltransferase family protein [Sphingomonas kyeonggiensis]MBB4840025.1 peptidoglycan/LPS O-acetylase OafA/YrhL [Sphingomonas kyeonggiensis]
MTGERSGPGPGYIPAIDGLRAIAVTSVILFHLWPWSLPGGFTGVDIFFVISGFVVTGSLVGREFTSFRQLTAYFYARRLMRIMPALVVMLLVALLASQLFIPDAWLSNSLSQVARFAFFGLSNVVLATDTDSYFGPQAAYNPFTHTWSLGVEEQFYLFFPFILWWHHRLHSGAKAVRLVAILSALSLLLCAVLGIFAQKFAFYLIFPRFWELGTGMLLCLTRERWQPWAAGRRWIAPLGMLLIAAGFAIPEGPLFPFPGALLPVAGTSLAIMAILGGTAPRALGGRPMVAVGLLSYSLYLWHWPVFVLFRWTVGLHTLQHQLAALVIAVALAIFSYFLVEKPLRSSRRLAGWPRGRVVAVAVAGVLVATLGGQLLISAHNRITLSVTRDRFAWYAEPRRPLPLDLTGCAPIDAEEWLGGGRIATWTARCAQGEGFTLFVPADSHGLAYSPALRRLAAETGARVRLYFKPGCPYLKLIQTHASRPRCTAWYEAVETEIAARSKPGDVVFLPGLRLTRLANQFENDRDLIGAREDVVSDTALVEARGITQRLAAGGARLVLEAPKPVFPSPVFRCADWFNRANPSCHGLTIEREQMLERRRHVMRAMSALVASEKPTILWDPLPLFCPGQTCEALPGGRPLFFDGDHPSGLGNDLVYADLKRTVLGVR